MKVPAQQFGFSLENVANPVTGKRNWEQVGSMTEHLIMKRSSVPVKKVSLEAERGEPAQHINSGRGVSKIPEGCSQRKDLHNKSSLPLCRRREKLQGVG